MENIQVIREQKNAACQHSFVENIKRKKVETILAVFAIVAIIIAWLVGIHLEDADILSTIKTQMPETNRFEDVDKATLKLFDQEDEFMGYLTIESSAGYGGPLQMAVCVDEEGRIFDLAVISSKETPSYLAKVLDAKLFDKIIGRSYNEKYSIGNGIDGISSATYSSRAIIEASKKGSRYIAANVLGFEVLPEEKAALHFGMAEIVLILLFLAGYIAHRKTFRYKNAARWITMLSGLFVIGFIYNKPFSLSMVNQLLLGYFPPLHSHLYWYLLLGGFFLILTIDNKNPYCTWFCPFGAAQECLGLVGGAKHRSAGKFKEPLKWTLRIVTLSAIILALLFRNPGVTSYEIFGTLFKLTGSNIQFALLGIIVVSSMFIKRPWCNYLCPVGPLTDHLSHIRKIMVGKWKEQRVKV